MPEYLSPGVYVEEVDTGSKPIEGVSTSTAAMLGVSERGPVDVPILVTSVGDFYRKFGGRLLLADFNDNGRGHGYLPFAVEGFFKNGGKRLYITRVLPEVADFSDRELFDRGTDASAETVLLRAAPQGSGTLINQPPIYVLDNTGIAVNDHIRVGNGSHSEYREVTAMEANALHVALSSPLDFPHDVSANNVEHIAETNETGFTGPADFLLEGDYTTGATRLTLRPDTNPADVNDLLVALNTTMASQLLRIGAASVGEYQFALAESARLLPGNQIEFDLSSPLKKEYVDGVSVQALEIPVATTVNQLSNAANAADLVAYLDSLGGGFAGGDLVIIDSGTAQAEVRRITDLAALSLDVQAYQDYASGTAVNLVSMDDVAMTITNIAPIPADLTWITLDDVSSLEVGMRVNVDDGGVDEEIRLIVAIDAGANNVQLDSPPPGALVGGESVVVIKSLTTHANPGSVTLALDNRLGLQAGDVIQIGTAPDEEYLTIDSISGTRGVAPDAGNIRVTHPLRQDHLVGSEIRLQQAPVLDDSQQPLFLVVPSAVEPGVLNVSGDDGTTYTAGQVVAVLLASGDVAYHRITANSVLTPRQVELDLALDNSHEDAEAIVERESILQVRALDAGQWGDRLAVSIEDEASGMASGTEVNNMTLTVDPALSSTLRVASAAGIESGTVLELYHPDTGAVTNPPIKVSTVDRSNNNLITLDPGSLLAVHNTAYQNALLGGDRLRVRSREFRLSVFLRRQPDPAVPGRNDDVIDSEVFGQLSMDPRHSRYAPGITGTTWTAGNENDDNGTPLRISDRRSVGESRYIRIRDMATNAAQAQSARLGPEALIDILPSGLHRAARHDLDGGDDAVTSMNDAMYLGTDSDEPTDRTGLFSFRNIESISLVACPGQTTPMVQQALIDHCELMRYRFAVLDGQVPGQDTLADVQFQRQQFDSKYASLYHPWVTVPDPMPGNLATIDQIPLPPCGHTLGVFARTDVERGVHKAPANEVVRGITGLARTLNKEEHDIVNPYPVNINVIRDFRPNNRGIRIWGARVITSDPDYKYVNVRRLMIFLEHSIERGLQWATFEPNSEQLWSRVRRSITNFLTTTWRNGALEGATVEQSHFVKCDRTTMTQDDIDNGRLICVIGVAPVKPAEFVIMRIGLWTAESEQE